MPPVGFPQKQLFLIDVKLMWTVFEKLVEEK